MFRSRIPRSQVSRSNASELAGPLVSGGLQQLACLCTGVSLAHCLQLVVVLLFERQEVAFIIIFIPLVSLN